MADQSAPTAPANPAAKPGSREHQEYLERIALSEFEAQWRMVGIQLEIAGRLSTLGLQTLYVVNGGAVIALLGAAHTIFEPADRIRLVAPLALFALGVVATLVANVLGYWSQAAYASSRELWASARFKTVVENKQADIQDFDAPFGSRMWTSAMVLAAVAVSCTLIGAVFALCALF